MTERSCPGSVEIILVLHNLINIYSPRRLSLEYLKVLSKVHSGEKAGSIILPLLMAWKDGLLSQVGVN